MAKMGQAEKLGCSEDKKKSLTHESIFGPKLLLILGPRRSLKGVKYMPCLILSTTCALMLLPNQTCSGLTAVAPEQHHITRSQNWPNITGMPTSYFLTRGP